MADPAPRIISANDLFVGDVVYLDHAGGWTRRIEEAAVAKTEDDANALEALARQPLLVVGPYLLTVTLDDAGVPKPSHYREKIRDRGPTNRTDLDRRAAPAPQV